MVNRRFSQVATSDDEEDDRLQNQAQPKLRKRKRMTLLDEEDSDNDDRQRSQRDAKGKEKEKQVAEEPPPVEDAKPLGDPVRVSGKGRGRKRHYNSFEYDGNQYTLEDPVLLVPEDKDQKPYVAIIKDITQSSNGSIMVTGQWFYRPEEAEQQGGGSWQSQDTRELFYSFHRDDVPAESVMHKCVVHFVPIHKQLPKRKEHPGFIVQKVYDTVERKLWRLTDKDYEDCKQQEIDELVQKTLKHIGELRDIDTEEAPADQEDPAKNKRSSRPKRNSPLDLSSRDEEGNPKGDQNLKPETTGSCVNNSSEYYRILVNFNALTGDTHRDKWLEKLLEHIQYVCNSDDNIERDDKRLQNGNSYETNNRSSESTSGCEDKGQESSKSFIWPDTAVPAIVALEKASHVALSSDFQKYNIKLRSLDYNLKNNALLARRLLNGELEPSKIINMSPNELREAFTAEEMGKKEPDDSQLMQMTDARCSRCTECKVGLRDIIHAGHGDRYQLECVACGNSWYASRDEVSTLTIDASDSKISRGKSPLAAAKVGVEKKPPVSPSGSGKSAAHETKKPISPRESENSAREIKKLVSPVESEKSALEANKKTSESRIPVLDAQKSLGKSSNDDNILRLQNHAD